MIAVLPAPFRHILQALVMTPVCSTRLFGWTPPHNEDYADLLMSSNQAKPRNSPFCISEISQESSTRASFTNAANVDDDRQPGTGKFRDQNWVARPRNDFILFRCEFVRNHSRESNCSRPTRTLTEGQDKPTLSKQAAEAWYHLSPEERLFWKERAIRECKEHARKYPDYRYRPRKSTEARGRSFRSFAAQLLPSSCTEGKIENLYLGAHLSQCYQCQITRMHHCFRPSKYKYVAHRGLYRLQTPFLQTDRRYINQVRYQNCQSKFIDLSSTIQFCIQTVSPQLQRSQ